jgi:hypothetical protein
MREIQIHRHCFDIIGGRIESDKPGMQLYKCQTDPEYVAPEKSFGNKVGGLVKEDPPDGGIL